MSRLAPLVVVLAALFASFAALFATLFATPARALDQHAQALRSPLGTNLAEVADWSTQRPFADLFKQSRAWISNTEQQWDDGRPIDVDARGWVRSLLPGQRARTLVAWGEPAAQLVRGQVIVTWTGDGQLDFWPQRKVRIDAANKRAVIDVDPSAGLAVTIEKTNPRDPVRDIKVFRKGNEGRRFDPVFVASLRGYSTLRFMDWLSTNAAEVRTWSERAVPADARWTTHKGVPLEVIVELCNEVDADLWLTVPDTWDDAAVASAAQLVHAQLEPGRAIYVEHSNEVWNDMFPQAQRARAKGKAKRLARDEHQARLIAHAQRSVEIFDVFARVVPRGKRDVVRVMGAQMANTWASKVLLEAAQKAGGRVDALAVAPYFGHDVKSTDLDAIFRALEQDVGALAYDVGEQARVAKAHGARLLAYEGGQHLVATGPGGQGAVDARAKAFGAANRDPRMGALYRKALAAWKQGGGELYVHFHDASTPGVFGAWGARERVDQPRDQAPKLDALLTFAESTPAWW